MRIVCMTNEGQLPMMKNMLRSALESGFDMKQFHCYLLNSQKEAATYNTQEFKSLMVKKLEVVLMNLELDSEVLWVDNDIVFFQNCVNDIRKHTGRFVMQDDLWAPCCGFFFVRKSLASINTLRACIRWLDERKDNPNVNDQHAFLATYKRVPGLIVTLLPKEEYPNGRIYFDFKIKANAKMVHCNYVTNTTDKVQRLKDNNLWNPTDQAFELTNKYPF